MIRHAKSNAGRGAQQYHPNSAGATEIGRYDIIWQDST
jgi:hypothetical protein